MSPRGRLAMIAALLLLALLICTATTATRIERDLLTRAQLAVAAAGIPYYGLEVDGRDAILRGFVQSREEAERVRTTVAAVHGVRVVRDEVVIERLVDERTRGVPSAPPAGRQPVLRLQRLGPNLFLAGMLPGDDLVERLHVAAIERFGERQVETSLRAATAVATPSWLGELGRLVEILALADDNARLTIEGNTALLWAQISRPEDRDRIESIAAVVPGLHWRIDLYSPRQLGGAP